MYEGGVDGWWVRQRQGDVYGMAGNGGKLRQICGEGICVRCVPKRLGFAAQLCIYMGRVGHG